MQPVSFISSQNALIRLHFLMSSIGSRYIKELYIRLLLSCTKLFFNILPYYLSKSLDLSKPKHKGLRSQHNLNIPRTFKKAGDQAFPLLDHVYGTLFLFRSGTLNQMISSKSNWKPICIHNRYRFIMSSCCIVFLYTKIVYVFLVSALCNLRKGA